MAARALALLVALLIALPAGASVKKYAASAGSGGGGGGGSGAAFEFCRDGTKRGFPETAAYRELAFACANFNWSAIEGGVDAQGVSAAGVAVTTGGNSENVVCSGDTTGVSDKHGSVSNVGACLNGEHDAYLNKTADAMIAWDWTRDSGRVVFPVSVGHAATVYQMSGCGMQSDGVTANSCPVLRPPHHKHRQRDFQTGRGIRMIFEGQDPDGSFRPVISANVASVNRETMTGAWLLSNEGNAGSPNDPNGDAVSIYLNNNIIGYDPSGTPCTKVSGTDFRCAAGNGANRMGASHWSGNTTILSFSTGVDENNICLNNVPKMCSGRRDIVCTTGTEATDCDDGTTDYGPCIGFVDALVADNTATVTGTDDYTEGIYVAVQQPLYDDFAETLPQLTAYYTLRTISRIEDPYVACATTGERVRFGSSSTNHVWPFESQAISAGSAVYHVDMRNVAASPGFIGGTWMPQNWAGRDSPGTANDCDASGVGASCDRGSLIKYRLAQDAVLENASLLRCSRSSNSCIDGGSWPSIMRNNTIYNFKFGAWGDISELRMFDNRVFFNTTAGVGFNCFAGNCAVKRNRFIGNQSGSALIGTGRGRQVFVSEGNTFAENLSPLGHVNVSNGGYVTLRDDACSAGEGAYATIRPGTGQKSFVTIDGLRTTGQACVEPDGSPSTGKAAVVITAFGGTGSIGNVTVKNVQVETNQNLSCAVYIDNRAVSTAFLASLGNVTLENISIIDPTGTATLGGVCADDFNVAGDSNSSTDDNVFTLTFPPIMKNIKVSDVARPESQVPFIDASDNQGAAFDCNNQQAGTMTCINDDTAVGACTDAGVNGILDGGGAAKSCCVCNGAGDHVAFP